MPPSVLPAITIAGQQELWTETLGDDQICVAVLDGWVDRSHPCFAGAKLTPLESMTPTSPHGPAAQHGTHVASIIFGQHHQSVHGIAPQCRGVLIPIFADGHGNAIAPCSQLDLARAILLAANHGAQIINISGGQLSASGEADPLLANAVRQCIDQNILIVAAAGNDGCNCLHIPGALPSVLTVGAMNAAGLPLDFSNWGEAYHTQGIVAVGENIPGAIPGGGIATNSGTSYATAIVSGIAALLLSLQVKRGQAPNPRAVRNAILQSAIDCEAQPATDCRRLLAGRLNVKGAMSMITALCAEIKPSFLLRAARSAALNKKDVPHALAKRCSQSGETMNENLELAEIPFTPVEALSSPLPLTQHQMPGVQAATAPAPAAEVALQIRPSSSQLSQTNSGAIQPAACSCEGGNGTTAQLVYALGQLGYDFGTEARRDSIQQHMGEGVNPQDPRQLLTYLEDNPWDAAALIWTLNLDATPIYAIQPQGAYADRVYERLMQFLREQFTEGVERVSIPGVIGGQVMLMSGQVVPVILPTLRCMYSWTTGALLEAVCGTPPAESASEQDRSAYGQRSESMSNFLERVYYELRNLGITSQERAINYAATNAFNVERIFQSAMQEEIDLESIEVERSPLCRPGSDCWDVKLTFFHPRRVFEQARKVYRFTVDVSDVCPVSVGRVRSWFVR